MWRRHCLRVVFASWSNSRFTYHFDHVLNISMYFILKMCLPFCIHHQLAFFFSFSAKYIGCYVDDTQKRALRGVSFFDYKKMTVFRCQDNCAERYDSNKLQKTLIHEISLFFSSLFVFLLSGWEIKWKSWCWQWLKGAPSFRARMIKDLMARYWPIQACHRYAVYNNKKNNKRLEKNKHSPQGPFCSCSGAFSHIESHYQVFSSVFEFESSFFDPVNSILQRNDLMCPKEILTCAYVSCHDMSCQWTLRWDCYVNHQFYHHRKLHWKMTLLSNQNTLPVYGQKYEDTPVHILLCTVFLGLAPFVSMNGKNLAATAYNDMLDNMCLQQFGEDPFPVSTWHCPHGPYRRSFSSLVWRNLTWPVPHPTRSTC